MTRIRNEIRQSGILLAGTAGTVALSLAYTMYALRLLGPEASSAFSLAVSFVAFCQIALGPINGTVARFSAKFAAEGDWGKVCALGRVCFRRTLMATVALLVPALAFVEPASRFWNLATRAPLVLAYGIVALTLVLSISRGLLRGLQSFGHLTANTVFEAALRLAAGMVILQFVPSATAALGGFVIALVGVLLLSQWQLGGRLRTYATEPFDGREVVGFAGPLLLMMLASAGFQNGDMLAVKHLFPDLQAGLYGATFSIARLIGALVTPFSILLLPLLTSAHARGESTVGPLIRVVGYFVVLATAVLLAFGLFADRLVVLLFGSAFADAGAMLPAVASLRMVGFLCHLLALAGAARNRFACNYILIPSLLVQAALVRGSHERMVDIVHIMFWSQLLTLALMVGLEVRQARNQRP
ncbi:MAG: hypothetical protein ACE5E5_12565 [Phycisphaerae bacterium]